MPADLNLLVPTVRLKAMQVINTCADKNVEILIYCTLRTLEDQARLYRSSRSLLEIQEKAKKFRDRGFGFLADVLMDVGPQPGKLGLHSTKACCGESFHNYAEAFDAVPLINKYPKWDEHSVEYHVYGDAVRDTGLVWAGDWITFKECPHAQLRAGSNPLKIYSVDQVKNMLRDFGLI